MKVTTIEEEYQELQKAWTDIARKASALKKKIQGKLRRKEKYRAFAKYHMAHEHRKIRTAMKEKE